MKLIQNKIYKLLRWSEKYTKTDMVYFASGGSWLFLGQIITSVAGILLAIGFANLLPKEIYGNYKFILSLGGIIGALTLTGMGTAVTQAVARGYEGEIRAGFWTQLKWSFFILLASLAGALYYFLNDNSTIAISFLIIGFLLPISKSASLYRSFLNGKKEFKRGTIYSTVQNVVPLLILFGAIFFTQNIVTLIFVTFVSQAVMAIVMYIKTLRVYKPSSSTDEKTTDFAKHLSLLNILGATATHIDKILIFHFLGAAQLAIYAFAILIPTQINGLLKKVNQLAFPKFSERSKEEVKNGLLQKTQKLVIFSALLSISYVVAAPYIFGLLFPQYTESIIYSQLYSLNIILTGSVLLVATFFQSHKLIKEIHIVTIFHHTLRISLMLLLISEYGIFGIIFSILIARSAMILLSYILVKYN